jgi:hypothetical protein
MKKIDSMDIAVYRTIKNNQKCFCESGLGERRRFIEKKVNTGFRPSRQKNSGAQEYWEYH